jgi:segregation and condensation protein A
VHSGEPAPSAEPAGSVAVGAAEESRFPVDIAGYRGSLEDLVRRAQRGDIDLTTVQVSEITSTFRDQLRRGGDAMPLRDVADFLTLVARLVALKAGSVMPEQTGSLEDEVEADADETDAGRRLAEYRLFKAAAEALLSEAADEGARSFLGMVVPDVIPVERLRIPPERLAAAFRTVLERLSEAEPLPVGAVTFSVEDKMDEIRRRLSAGRVAFEELFTEVGSRLEAVACFLALLELLKRGEATVEQDEPFGPIAVFAGG